MRLLTFFAIPAALFAQPVFDAATVKPVNFDPGSMTEKIVANPGNLTMRSVRLRAAIMWAYEVKDFQITGPSWLGAPGWRGADVARFEVLAKAPEGTPTPEMRRMLQQLLAERFKLVLHRETKEVSTMVLTAAKPSSQMKPSADQEAPMRGVPGATGIGFLNTTMAEFANFLSGPLGAPVFDRTGLKGRVDFTLSNPPGNSANEELAGLPSQLRSELGLELKRDKAPLEFLIVDSAEKMPIAN